MGTRSTLLPIIVVSGFVMAACGADGPEARRLNDVPTCERVEPVEMAAMDMGADTHDETATDTHDETATDTHDEAALGVDDVDVAYALDMIDIDFGCKLPTVPLGTVVQLQFVNTGQIEHEAVIGDQAAQDAAEQAMRAAGPATEHGHDHATPSISLGPGESGQLIVHFDEPGDLIMGCHVAGHYEAGMHLPFSVST